jgi:hypothetical protein
MKLKILAIGILLIMTSNIFAIASSENKIETNDIAGWQQINEDGFGKWTNRMPRGITIFNNSLIVGTTANTFSDNVLKVNITWPFLSFFKDFAELMMSKKGFIGGEIWSYNGTDWKPLVANESDSIMQAGFGNGKNYQIGVLIEYKGYLYAGTTNEETGCEVWRTNSIYSEWEKVVDEGFGNKNNDWVMSGKIFNDELYMGTQNPLGLEVYKTNDGVNWVPVVSESAKTKPGFGNTQNAGTYSMAIYDSNLFIGTANRWGCELWKSSDGENWEPVIAYKNLLSSKLHKAVFPAGFGMLYIPGIRNMIVFNDELYLLTASSYNAVYSLKIFDRIFSINGNFRGPPIRLMKYIQSLGTKVFKYNSTTNKITSLVVGPGKTNNSAGFGDKYNLYSWSVLVHDGYLYVGTLCPDPLNVTLERKKLLNWEFSVGFETGRAQIWRTSDGTNWEKVVGDGFGDNHNVGVRSLKIYNDSIYAVTANLVTGCEVWKLDVSHL